MILKELFSSNILVVDFVAVGVGFVFVVFATNVAV